MKRRAKLPGCGRTAGVALSAALLLILAVMLAAGCGSSGTDTTETTAAPASTTSSALVPGTTEAPVTTESPTTTVAEKLPKLTLVAPPGPMAIPMAYLAVNNKLAGVADKTELVIWQNADQLKALVAGKQGDFVTIPSNNSAMFYNKGLQLKLLDISVWNITYLITRDAKAGSFSDVKGQSLVVSLKGSVPDVMFQYLTKKEGLDPAKDFKLQYATDPTQAAQLLLAGKVDNAVLSEALATSVILQTKSDATPLRRALAFDQAWAQAAGDSKGTPIAGTVATATVMEKPEVVDVFLREYRAAVEWMLANPEEAGKLVETELPQLGLKAAPLTASLKSINWKFTPAQDARAGLEAFYTALMDLSPEVIGGKLPDDGFYYAP
jgi:NitT/TauT family transport system substrate-binding protein